MNKDPILIARAFLVNSSGRYLFLQRPCSENLEVELILPGVKLYENETISERIIKKRIEEKTSLNITNIESCFHQEHKPTTTNKNLIPQLYFKADWKGGHVKTNDESMGWAWIHPDGLNLYNVGFRNDTALLEYLRKKA